MSHLATAHRRVAASSSRHSGKSRTRCRLEVTLSRDEKGMAYDILRKEGRLNACPSCGGIDLSIPPTAVDVLGGFSDSGKYYCVDCGYEGKPIAFRNERIYEKFFHARRIKYNEGAGLEPNYLIPLSTGSVSRSEPYIASLFSFVLPGMGQAYNGERVKGASLAVIFLLLEYTIFQVVRSATANLFNMFSLIAVCFMILVYALFDAYFIASKKLKNYKAAA